MIINKPAVGELWKFTEYGEYFVINVTGVSHTDVVGTVIESTLARTPVNVSINGWTVITNPSRWSRLDKKCVDVNADIYDRLESILYACEK